ncbi:hypothetical protein [Erwinia aphidicola]|uniref:Uncharacterized protein n=1 Tax=Erwinia aphidicola TaxID=68334 RepID=A0ABU8DM92_ERWAP
MTRHITGIRKSKEFSLTEIVSLLVISLVLGVILALFSLYVDAGVSAWYTGIGAAAFVQSFVGIMVCYYEEHPKVLPGYILGAGLLLLAHMNNWGIELNSAPTGMFVASNNGNEGGSDIFTFAKDYGSLLAASLALIIPPLIALSYIPSKKQKKVIK